jgi:integrase
MASRGRPPLRIGAHGKITRIPIGGGVWLARCRFRDADGVTRIVQRRGPDGDKHGKGAEDALLESLKCRRPPVTAGGISTGTPIVELIDCHIDQLEADGRAVRTVDTYRDTAKRLRKFIAGLRVGDSNLTARMHAAVTSMRDAHGAATARQARTILRGGMRLAVLAEIIDRNPVVDIKVVSKRRPKGAPGLSAEQLRALVNKVMASQDCRRSDLADPIVLLAATGLRRSELLGLRWSDYNRKNATIAVSGKVIRAAGKGLMRIDETKTEDSARTVKLPSFAVDMLSARRRRAIASRSEMIFPTSVGTLRAPESFSKQWRAARMALGVPDVTSHSFRKTVATLIDEQGLSARVGADQLGHAKVSMTQDVYMRRGQVHAEVADLLDRAVSGAPFPMNKR